ncbi:MAG TPA: hypothetical protein PLN13_09485 [Bacteroidia bacterium]|nr:hypothetical protein [Bacteroidia bacterium]HRH08800.1 hypothetical protein [Bacteroidia bacterium]
MKKQNLILTLVLVSGMLFVNSCKTQKKAVVEEACASPAPTYSANVKSIIESNCSVSGCHSKGKGDLRVFENLKREADEGAIKNLVVVKKKMPPNKPLSDSDIKLIDCWLKDGGKEN